MKVQWEVLFHDEFLTEFLNLPVKVQDAIAEKALLISKFGPQLGRPHVDVLIGSNYNNMKELRIQSTKGVWRVAFAFDPFRQALILVAGNKKGINQNHFYKELIKIADSRFANHLSSLN